MKHMTRFSFEQTNKIESLMQTKLIKANKEIKLSDILKRGENEAINYALFLIGGKKLHCIEELSWFTQQK